MFRPPAPVASIMPLAIRRNARLTTIVALLAVFAVVLTDMSFAHHRPGHDGGPPGSSGDSEPAQPVAAFEYSPAEPVSGEPVVFDGSASVGVRWIRVRMCGRTSTIRTGRARRGCWVRAR